MTEHPIRQYPDERREKAETDMLRVFPPTATWEQQTDGTWTLPLGDGYVNMPATVTADERDRFAAALAEQPARTTPENPPTSSDTPDNLHRLRVWLAAEYDKADAADRVADIPPELMIRPHNGIAAGIAIALHGIDCMLGETQPAHDAGPTVAECRQDDLRWDVEKGGE